MEKIIYVLSDMRNKLKKQKKYFWVQDKLSKNYIGLRNSASIISELSKSSPPKEIENVDIMIVASLILFV